MSTLIFAIAITGWFLAGAGGSVIGKDNHTGLGVIMFGVAFLMITGAFAWATW